MPCCSPQFRGLDRLRPRLPQGRRSEWGGKMQTDLIDGVDDLAAQGVVDPSRVCIVGSSFGGFAALSGATAHPATSTAAPSRSPGWPTPGLLLGQIVPPLSATTIDMPHDCVGEQPPRRSRAARRSPARRTRARAPILLVHSAQDTTVPPRSSPTAMARGAEGAAKPVHGGRAGRRRPLPARVGQPHPACWRPSDASWPRTCRSRPRPTRSDRLRP